MAGIGYNAAEVPPDERGEFTLMPEAPYTFLVSGSELKPGKNPSNKRLIFTVECQGPTHKGRKLWPEFNIVHISAEAQKIARQQLNKFAEACGIPAASLTDSSQLHNKLFTGNVVVIPEQPPYKAKNEIKGYSPAGGAQAAGRPAFQAPRAQAQAPAEQPAQQPSVGQPAQQPASAPAPAAAGGAAPPPWMKQA